MLYKTRIITLNSINPQTGSVFLLEYSSDCTNYYTTSVSNITGSGDIYIPITYTSSLNWNAYINTITLSSVGATASVLIPQTATCLRLTNLVGTYAGTQYVEIIGTSPTGSSTTTTTTTTTLAPTTTTTTTLAPTTTTTTTTAAPTFYDIVDYGNNSSVCVSPISSFSMAGNGTTFCNSTVFTSSGWYSIATGNYVVAYLGNYQQVSHTQFTNTATVYGGGCTSCPSSTTTTTTTAAPPTYNYYTLTRYNCPSCSGATSGLIGRNNTTGGILTTNHYYNNGDGYVYRIDGYSSGAYYDIDLDGSASAGTDCTGTCAI